DSSTERDKFNADPAGYLQGRKFQLSTRDKDNAKFHAKAILAAVSVHPNVKQSELPFLDLSQEGETIDFGANDPYLTVEPGWLGVYLTFSNQAAQDLLVTSPAVLAGVLAAAIVFFPEGAPILATLAALLALDAAIYGQYNTHQKGVVVLVTWAGIAIPWPRS
ncbi:MAG TPA: hypothetical protein VMM92_12930, partial [Thermoanaerobaculia bacterium]|nr:hypothetical protein [Thermoanaerobaculia bacterium]